MWRVVIKADRSNSASSVYGIMSAAGWRPAVSRSDELDPTKYSATQTATRPYPARQQALLYTEETHA